MTDLFFYLNFFFPHHSVWRKIRIVVVITFALSEKTTYLLTSTYIPHTTYIYIYHRPALRAIRFVKSRTWLFLFFLSFFTIVLYQLRTWESGPALYIWSVQSFFVFCKAGIFWDLIFAFEFLLVVVVGGWDAHTSMPMYDGLNYYFIRKMRMNVR